MATDEASNAGHRQTRPVDASTQELDTFNNDMRLRGDQDDLRQPACRSSRRRRSCTSAPACSATAPTTRSNCARRSTRAAAPTSSINPVDSRGLQAIVARRQRAGRAAAAASARSRAAAWRSSSRSWRRSRRRCRRSPPTPAARRLPTRTTSARRSTRCRRTSRRTTSSATSSTNTEPGRHASASIEVQAQERRWTRRSRRAKGYYADRDFTHTAKDGSRDRDAGAADDGDSRRPTCRCSSRRAISGCRRRRVRPAGRIRRARAAAAVPGRSPAGAGGPGAAADRRPPDARQPATTCRFRSPCPATPCPSPTQTEVARRPRLHPRRARPAVRHDQATR